jgi:hypothetical protein
MGVDSIPTPRGRHELHTRPSAVQEHGPLNRAREILEHLNRQILALPPFALEDGSQARLEAFFPPEEDDEGELKCGFDVLLDGGRHLEFVLRNSGWGSPIRIDTSRPEEPGPDGSLDRSLLDACSTSCILATSSSIPVGLGAHHMAPLERLFALEVESHRRLRAEAPGPGDARALHTSYALQSGYEQLLRQIGRITGRDLEMVLERFLLAADPRDVLAARDSIQRLVGLPGIER